MSALTAERQRTSERWRYKSFNLIAGAAAFKGANMGVYVSGGNAGNVGPMSTAANQKYLGTCWRSVSSAASVQQVTIRFERDLELEWLLQDGSITAAQIGQSCYASDDQSVSLSASSASGLLGYSPLGVVYGIDPVLGVLVSKNADIAGISFLKTAVLPAPIAGVISITQVSQDCIFSVPVLAAPTVIQLPAPALLPIGLRCTIVANGVKNSQTVQYQETGSVMLTPIFAANKRHQVLCIVSPENIWVCMATAQP